MMNLKYFCTGLALSGLGILFLGTQADAYSFTSLGNTTAGGGLTNYRFQFSVSPNEVILPNQALTISGFKKITSLSLAASVDNVYGVLPSGYGFKIGSISVDKTTAIFHSIANINSVLGIVRFQAFVVTAEDVPTGIVDPAYPDPMNSLAPAAVPEPLTLLGAIMAAGFGAAFKRHSSKSVE